MKDKIGTVHVREESSVGKSVKNTTFHILYREKLNAAEKGENTIDKGKIPG